MCTCGAWFDVIGFPYVGPEMQCVVQRVTEAVVKFELLSTDIHSVVSFAFVST